MTYSADYFAARESWRDWRIEARALIDLARVTRGARTLEIGCGGGGLLRMLRERGARVVGVDTLQVALLLAAERFEQPPGKLTRRQGDKEGITLSPCHPVTRSLLRIGKDDALPFRDAAFDAIIGQHVVEHLPDTDVALREYKRLLKPNGRLALATPNARYPDPAHFADADHTRVFTPRELRERVEHAGFVVESCSTIFPFLSRARLLRAFGVIAYRLFQRAPYFATRGRTIMLSASNP